jgi:hypothetical protein
LLPVCAPLRAKWISLTPEPPLSSVAVSATLAAVWVPAGRVRRRRYGRGRHGRGAVGSDRDHCEAPGPDGRE